MKLLTLSVTYIPVFIYILIKSNFYFVFIIAFEIIYNFSLLIYGAEYSVSFPSIEEMKRIIFSEFIRAELYSEIIYEYFTE